MSEKMEGASRIVAVVSGGRRAERPKDKCLIIQAYNHNVPELTIS